MMPVVETPEEEMACDDTPGATSTSTGTPSSSANEVGQKSQSPRRSGRKVKQRILFGHSGSGLPGGTVVIAQSRKVKETSESSSGDEEQGGDDDDGEQSGKESNEDSDLEVPVQAPTPGRGRKRAAGIFKATPAAKKAKSKPFSVTSKRSRKKDRKTGEDTGQGSLFDIVKAGKGALRAVVDDWIESYTSDKETGMVDLIQFFVQCCGCKGTVTTKMLEEEESVNAIRQLTEQFDEVSDECKIRGAASLLGHPCLEFVCKYMVWAMNMTLL
ncbi:PREDICTED: cohesin subunit SA-3-like [Acropora digitifera]|uniref:cohesin subunit SA-3-like n=1 Tax=Acropora digitifera TaxID=70779 RepID=UPI000779F1E8|nr:PREDICTED: cohesin subunit SA-3-like [Acropora digitifera]XP_015762975.1 PREDICTED: cohesin subunit SA-3-like [Acropora digitifera]